MPEKVTVKLEPFDVKDETVTNCLFWRSYIMTCENGKLLITPAPVLDVVCASVNVKLPKSAKILRVLSTDGRSTIHSAESIEEL